jgi:hypothetical protein
MGTNKFKHGLPIRIDGACTHKKANSRSPIPVAGFYSAHLYSKGNPWQNGHVAAQPLAATAHSAHQPQASQQHAVSGGSGTAVTETLSSSAPTLSPPALEAEGGIAVAAAV